MRADMKTEVEEIAELTVRRYFDTFLTETLPTILSTHESGCCTKKLLKKVLWIGLGLAIGLGVSFPKLAEIIGQFR
jgi:hypothetical protein